MLIEAVNVVRHMVLNLYPHGDNGTLMSIVHHEYNGGGINTGSSKNFFLE